MRLSLGLWVSKTRSAGSSFFNPVVNNPFPMNSFPDNLLSRKLLARNTLFNLLGSVLPILVAILAIPILIRGIGTERFGILSLVWMFVGYFSLFDLGLGKAVTKLVAEKISTKLENQIPPLFWTSVLLMSVLGVVGSGIVLGGAQWLVCDVLKVSSQFEHETIFSFYAIAFSMPFIINTSALRGVLIAYQRFGLVNAIRIPQGILNYLAPLAILPFSRSLSVIVFVLVGVRILVWGAHLYVCLKHYPILHRNIQVKLGLVRPLLSFGGWMTVTNIVSPLMTYLDRFFIASVVSTTAVAYYAAPYQVVTKLLVVPGALLGVFFPAFSSSLSTSNERAQQLFENAIQAIFFILFPVVLIILLFAYEGLELWLGVEFAVESTVVLQLLSVGFLINSLTLVPFTFIQSAGRPDLTAKFHLLEFPIYIIALLVILPRYGIVGAAGVWVVRVVLDGILLFGATMILFPASVHFIKRLAVVFSTLFSSITRLVASRYYRENQLCCLVSCVSIAGFLSFFAR